jgi:hypothetical protein
MKPGDFLKFKSRGYMWLEKFGSTPKLDIGSDQLLMYLHESDNGGREFAILCNGRLGYVVCDDVEPV